MIFPVLPNPAPLPQEGEGEGEGGVGGAQRGPGGRRETGVRHVTRDRGEEDEGGRGRLFC